MSFRQSGIPSSFFKCRILFPEYTDEMLPLAFRLLDVVFAVGAASFGDVLSSPGTPSVFGVSAAVSSV